MSENEFNLLDHKLSIQTQAPQSCSTYNCIGINYSSTLVYILEAFVSHFNESILVISFILPG